MGYVMSHILSADTSRRPPHLTFGDPVPRDKTDLDNSVNRHVSTKLTFSSSKKNLRPRICLCKPPKNEIFKTHNCVCERDFDRESVYTNKRL